MTAPIFNSFNALNGPEHASEVFWRSLSEADEFIARADGATSEVEFLREENARLECRVDELDDIANTLVDEKADLRGKLAEMRAEDDAKAEMIGQLRAQLELRTGQLIAARDELPQLREQLDRVTTERDQARAERDTYRLAVTS